jgi:thiamine pyrophosphokinase
MVALILADGDAPTRASLDLAWPGWDDAVEMVIAADGGARHAAGLEVAIDLWVGDGDSIGAEALAALEAAGVPLERSESAKDESDTELAIAAAIRLGADGIIVVGALGGSRIDHALANIGLLAMPVLAGRPATILDADSRIGLIRAPGSHGEPVEHPLPGAIGGLVSLLPVGDGVEGVTTRGLAYPLNDEALPAGPARGLSNVRTAPDAAVVVRGGLLLVVETPATL